MSANAERRLYTADDLLAMDEDERYELVRGELRVMEPEPGPAHGIVVTTLIVLLGAHVRERRLGVVFAPTAFQLARDPDTVRGPDVSFVRADRLPRDGMGAGYLELGPDLAVEVLSPSNKPGEMREKMDDYFTAGVRTVWIVDPRRRTVTVHAPGEAPRVLREGDALEGGDVVPGFRCAVAELFIGVRRDL